MRPPLIELEFLDIGRDGRVLAVRRCPVDSWLANAAAIFHAAFRIPGFSGGTPFTDVAGVLRTTQWRDGIGFDPHHIEMNGGVGQGKGIVVGTGTNPVVTGDFTLQSLISHGNGAGQLFRQAQGFNSSPVPITGGYQVQMSRVFDNNSGAGITINEVGIFAFQNHVNDQESTFMILRDLVPGGHLVADGNSVVVRYFFNWTV